MARMSQGHEGGKTLRLSILDQFQNLIQGNTSIQKEVRTDFYTLQARLKGQIQFIGMIGNDPDDPVQWKVLLHVMIQSLGSFSNRGIDSLKIISEGWPFPDTVLKGG